MTGIKFVLCPRVSPLPPLNTPLIFLFLSFFPFVFLPFFLYNSVIRYQSGIGFRRPRVPLKAWLDINTRERERERRYVEHKGRAGNRPGDYCIFIGLPRRFINPFFCPHSVTVERSNNNIHIDEIRGSVCGRCGDDNKHSQVWQACVRM